jgi:2-keto-4-pentenoate hydratase/2-oxohepta-3-ene-1,7-dioic acid hydratase in catechol pathway
LTDYCVDYFHEMPEHGLFVSIDERGEFHNKDGMLNKKGQRIVCFFRVMKGFKTIPGQFNGERVTKMQVLTWVLEHCNDVRDAIENDFGLEKLEDMHSGNDKMENDTYIKPYRKEAYMRFPDGHTMRERNAPIGTPQGNLNSPIIAPLFQTRIERSMNVLCVGKNYREHIGEVDTKMTNISAKGEPAVPIIFNKSSRSIIGHGECIQCPDPDQFDEQIDYEGEVGLVIGKEGKVYGATIVNDVTARFKQKEHQQWFLGKSVDTFCPIGPWIVPWFDYENSALMPFYQTRDYYFAEGLTPEEAIFDTSPSEPGGSCTIVTRVNGELRQNYDIAQEVQSDPPAMIFGHEELLETIKKSMKLEPCDVIATGTPAGVGAGQKPEPKWLKHGDIVEVKVGGVGVLTNYVCGYKRDPEDFVFESGQDFRKPKHRMFRMLPNRCAFCNKWQRKMSRCSQCKRVWYCSAECSKKDWTQQHRQECKDWVGVKEAEEREVEND